MSKAPACHWLVHANVALAKFPFDSPDMASFFGQVARINQTAFDTEGFIEEPILADKNSLYSEPFILNVTLWRSVDALKRFTFGADHAAVMQQRKQWFLPQDKAKYVLFWLPVGQYPTEQMIAQRLTQITEHGPSQDAFDFRHPFTA